MAMKIEYSTGCFYLESAHKYMMNRNLLLNLNFFKIKVFKIF